jgi:hypothetical protein
MKHALGFLENAITSSQAYLGLNRTEILDLSIHYLKRENDESCKRLHELTAEGLFNHITAEMLSNYETNNAVFNRLKALLESPWENETGAEIIKAYSESSRKYFLDPLLILLINSKSNESKNLAAEKMDEYFGREAGNFSTSESFFYSIHTLNVAFLLCTEDLTINKVQFVNYVKQNIFKLTGSDSLEIRRIAIWALYWLTGGSSNINPLIEIDKELQERVCSLIKSYEDMMSGLRLSYILIKTNSQLRSQLRKEFTVTWIKNIYYDKIEKKEYLPVSFAYSEMVEQCMLNALGLNDTFWRNEVIIPYLGLMAGKESIPLFETQLQQKNIVSFNCAIILSGMGLLTEDHVAVSGIKKSSLFDEVIRSYPNLIYQVKGKDTSGEPAWYFILIDENKKEEFLLRKRGDNYDLIDYGSIVASGYGEDVPEDIQNILKEKYGLDNF